MRLEREILTGRDAVVLPWKNILASVLCVLTLGGFGGRLSAQTTSQSLERTNQNYRSCYQSGQIADRSSFRERLGTNESVSRQDVETEQPRRPTSASDIWNAFLFGSLQPRTAAPKFAFSRKASNDDYRATRSNRRPNRALDNKPSQSVYSQSENERLAAMKQAGESLVAPNGNDAANAIGRNGVAFNQDESYAADNRAARRASNVSSAEERRRRIAELNAVLDARAQGVQLASYAEGNVSDAFNDEEGTIARVERSTIRQTSGVERRSRRSSQGVVHDENADETEVLPVRPQALRLSSRVFLSTEVVQLPRPGALVEGTPDGNALNEDALVKATSKEEKIPEIEPLKEEKDVVYDVPTFNSQSDQRNANAQVEAVAPLPSAPKPLPLKSERNESESRVLRSKASFIDPRLL